MGNACGEVELLCAGAHRYFLSFFFISSLLNIGSQDI
jgi:hypothetical protein